MTVRTYQSPLAFKAALETRLRSASRDGLHFARKRQLLVFDRFLARVTATFDDAVVLKGGLALELRLESPRATKDIDLRVTGSPDDILSRLQAAARRDLGDYLTFEIAADDEHPEIQNDGMKYEGLRFRSQCTLAGQSYGQPFGVDVAFGDPIFGAPDVVEADDVLGFVGVPPPKVRLYPIETHIAEKLHAYTLPRKRPNSRVKDLPDLALLGTVQRLEARRVRQAMQQTFDFRATHDLPSVLPAPSASWTGPYASMAAADGLRWPTLDEVTEAVRAFLDPVLDARSEAVWNPNAWRWESPEDQAT